jgi:hypothetical protein
VRRRAPSLLLRDDLALDLPPELERLGDARKRLLGAAGARDRDRTESEDPAYYSLIYPYRLDLAEEGFFRLALDEAELPEHSFVGDGKLRADVADGGAYGEEEADAGQCQPGVPVGRLDHAQQYSERNSQNHHDDRSEKNCPVQSCSVYDPFARQEVVIQVAHERRR